VFAKDTVVLTLKQVVHIVTTATYKSQKQGCLTLIVLMWRIGWAHNNARK